MKTQLVVALYIAMITQSNSLAHRTTDPDPLNTTTQVAMTLKWKDARDLSVQLNNSNDRITLARIVISQCITDNTLPDLTRIDGLRIAGHICYQAESNADAYVAFSFLRYFSDHPRWKAESLRMLAQLSMDDGDLLATRELFKEAWTHALLDDPSGIYASTKSILSAVCNLASMTDDHQGALDYALQGVALYSTPDTHYVKARYLYWAYQANKDLEENEAALLNLNDLLTNHPEYLENRNNFMGLPPMLRMDAFHLQGIDWTNPSADYIHEVLDIVSDPAYMFMPSRLSIVQRFTKYLENNANQLPAIELRTNFRNELEDELITNTEIDPFLKETLYHYTSLLALDNASLFIKRKDFVSATAILESLLNSEYELSDVIIDQATELNTNLNQQMQEL